MTKKKMGKWSLIATAILVFVQALAVAGVLPAKWAPLTTVLKAAIPVVEQLEQLEEDAEALDASVVAAPPAYVLDASVPTGDGGAP